jgi:hypothetical protein
MNKEEIKHFKSLLRQCSLRHMNILLDDKFQKELLTIIKNYEKLQHENKQLKEQLLVTQTNEETFRLEMKDITQTLGLDEDTLFDDVKVYVRSLKDNWIKLKEYIRKNIIYDDVGMKILDSSPLEDYMQELEQGSDSNE